MSLQMIEAAHTALVVGGGVGGMALAVSLAERGVKVELIDIDPDWKVYGAGITITGPTLRAYKRLGMLEAIKTHGAITNGVRIFLHSGQWLQDLDEPVIEEGLPATGGILRPVLHALMQERIRSCAIPVRLGLTVAALDNQDDGVAVVFSDGSKGSYDLVIGADSIYSGVRKLAFHHAVKPPFTGQGCWRLTMQRPPAFDLGEFYFGGPYPAGISACSPDSAYLWLLVPDNEHKRIPDAEMPERLRSYLSSFGGNIAWMRDRITDASVINYRPLEAAIQPLPWINGRVVLLGDAAHATTPHLACGAGMAVEDALVLAEELSVPGRAVTDSLLAYQARRYPRCKMVVKTSIAIGRLQIKGASTDEISAVYGKILHELASDF